MGNQVIFRMYLGLPYIKSKLKESWFKHMENLEKSHGMNSFHCGRYGDDLGFLNKVAGRLGINVKFH